MNIKNRIPVIPANVLWRTDDEKAVLFDELNGEPYILEINTIPGLTQTSLLPEAAQMAGIEFGALITRILESATKKVFTA